MKYNIFFFFLLIIEVFNNVNSLVRNTSNPQTLTADQNINQNNFRNDFQNNNQNNILNGREKNTQNNGQERTQNGNQQDVQTNNQHNVQNDNQNSNQKRTTSNNDSCEIQKMAEEMIENLLNEKDLFTSIMEALQSRLNDDYICTEQNSTNICVHEKDQKPLTFPCSSPKYETLIRKFTYRKLCHSKIAFSNVLLKSFIEKKESENTFNIILNNFNVLLKCVDSDLKEIYKSSIQLFTDLRTSVVDLSEKLWSQKIIDVLKKREHLIAGIFCELRNGNKSSLISNGLEFENFGILKINDEDILNEAFYAFSEYYYYFPYFATKLLEKNGMIERLIDIHEKLTNYRTQHILTKINEQSKNEVLNNEEVFQNLSKYKHHHNNQNEKPSFTEFNEVNNNDIEYNISKNEDKSVNVNTNNNIITTGAQDSSNPQKNDKGKSSQNNMVNNPLYSINSLKSKNIVELIKDLIKDTNIVKFENNEPTNNIDEEGIKKLIENSFLDLNDNTMLVRLLIKPQAVILAVIQSFILMTPSPERDAKTYCKKTLINGELIDSVDLKDKSEEEDLVNKFASKYNLVYEKIKLEELKEIEQNKKNIKNSRSNLSAIEVQNMQNKDGKNIPENTNNNNANITPLVAVVRDQAGEKAEDIINNNVDLTVLSADVEQTFKNPNKGSNGSLSMLFSSTLLFLFFILFHLIY